MMNIDDIESYELNKKQNSSRSVRLIFIAAVSFLASLYLVYSLFGEFDLTQSSKSIYEIEFSTGYEALFKAIALLAVITIVYVMAKKHK